MKRMWWLGIMGLLITALLAPAASASTIYFLAENTPIVTIGTTTLTPQSTSTVSYTGAASTTPTESQSISPVAGYPASQSYTGGIWLQDMEASSNKTVGWISYPAYEQLQGAGPTPGAQPGSISEGATIVLDYTFSHQRNQTLSVSDNYLYSYFLDNSGGNRFTSATETLTVSLYYNSLTGTPVNTWTIVSNSPSPGSPADPLDDFSSDMSGSVTPFTDTWHNNGANQHIYLVITASQAGNTMDPPPPPVPLPPSALLLGSGLLGLGLLGFRRKIS